MNIFQTAINLEEKKKNNWMWDVKKPKRKLFLNDENKTWEILDKVTKLKVSFLS